MNAKICKRLRRAAFFSVNEKNHQTHYHDKVVKRVQVPTMRLDEKGSIIMVEHKGEIVPEFYILPKITRTLDLQCLRGLYQNLKDSHAQH